MSARKLTGLTAADIAALPINALVLLKGTFQYGWNVRAIKYPDRLRIIDTDMSSMSYSRAADIGCSILAIPPDPDVDAERALLRRLLASLRWWPKIDGTGAGALWFDPTMALTADEVALVDRIRGEAS